MKEDIKISLLEASILFNCSRETLYQRIKSKKHIELFKEDGKLFLKLDSCLPLIQAEKEFLSKHILVRDADKKLFNSTSPVLENCYFHNKKYNFLPFVKYNHALYLVREDFEKFHASIDNQPLVKLGKIISLLGFDTLSDKFYYLLSSSNFYKEVRSFCFAEGGKKFYSYSDIKKWIKKNKLVTE